MCCAPAVAAALALDSVLSTRKLRGRELWKLERDLKNFSGRVAPVRLAAFAVLVQRLGFVYGLGQRFG
eukprot:COSAG05_NODE_24388_length_251_cov_6.065789_1_plen_67_part_01